MDIFGLYGFWRGSTSNQSPDFTPKPNEYKIDIETGLVKNTHGVSVFNNPESVSSRGFFPNEIDLSTIPEDLQIKQRGNDLNHYEIMPKESMELDDYIESLNKIECK